MSVIKLQSKDGLKIIEQDYEDVGYLAIPHMILNFTDITSSQKLVLGLICAFLFNGKPFTARNPYIARRLGIKERLVKDSILKLEKAGYIKRDIIHNTIRKNISLGRIMSSKLGLDNRMSSTGQQGVQSLDNRAYKNNNKDNNKYIINTEKYLSKKELGKLIKRI